MGCGQGTVRGQGWSENGLRQPPTLCPPQWPARDIPVALQKPGGNWEFHHCACQGSSGLEPGDAEGQGWQPRAKSQEEAMARCPGRREGAKLPGSHQHTHKNTMRSPQDTYLPRPAQRTSHLPQMPQCSRSFSLPWGFLRGEEGEGRNHGAGEKPGGNFELWGNWEIYSK